jgi:hypothetical protein
MKLRTTRRSRATSITVAALLPLILDSAPAQASTDASAHRPASSTPAQHGQPSGQESTPPRTGDDATLFATWGTVTNGNSSTNAAEHRKELTGGHAGSANAAEAPAFAPTP